MIDPELIKIMCCPETHQSVKLADAALVARLNERVGTAGIKNRRGEVISEKLDAGLIRADGKYLYPVRQDIPVMLVEEAIPLEG